MRRTREASSLQVGITTDWVKFSGRERLELDRFYLDWLRASGIAPRVIPSFPGDAGILLAGVSALVLSGGGDIPPRFYGGAPEPLPEEKYSHTDRCEFEQSALQEAVRVGLPVLGICLGCQSINAFFGGGLIRHLDDPQHIHRRVGSEEKWPTHPVRFLEGSRLAELAGPGEHLVCSSHHQAVGRLADTWKATAWAPDGVVEAIESEDYPAMLGLQWHPERLPESALSRRLGAWLREQALRYEAGN